MNKSTFDDLGSRKVVTSLSFFPLFSILASLLTFTPTLFFTFSYHHLDFPYCCMIKLFRQRSYLLLYVTSQSLLLAFSTDSSPPFFDFSLFSVVSFRTLMNYTNTLFFQHSVTFSLSFDEIYVITPLYGNPFPKFGIHIDFIQ